MKSNLTPAQGRLAMQKAASAQKYGWGRAFFIGTGLAFVYIIIVVALGETAALSVRRAQGRRMPGQN
jgi:hypothetical protein